MLFFLILPCCDQLIRRSVTNIAYRNPLPSIHDPLSNFLRSLPFLNFLFKELGVFDLVLPLMNLFDDFAMA